MFAYGSLVPALSLVKKVSKRDTTGRSLPNVVISPASRSFRDLRAAVATSAMERLLFSALTFAH